MNPDQTAPKEQSDLGPYCLQCRLPESIRQEEQTTKVVTDGLRVKSFSVKTTFKHFLVKL